MALFHLFAWRLFVFSFFRAALFRGEKTKRRNGTNQPSYIIKMDSSDNGIMVGDRGNIVGVTRLENHFKKDKCRTKSNFTRSRNNLLLLVEEQDMPSRRAVKEACRKMDSCLELVMEVLTHFLDFYTKNGELQKDKKIISEMEKNEEDYYTAY